MQKDTSIDQWRALIVHHLYIDLLENGIYLKLILVAADILNC